MPELTAPEGSDFYFVDAVEPEDAARKLLSVLRDRIPARFALDPVRDVQVLCSMNRGGLGARSLNFELRQTLNPPGTRMVERFGRTFCPGDKVMQVANDYERDGFNGDLGIITDIDVDESTLIASFEGRRVEYGFGELARRTCGCLRDYDPQGAGSEYPAVVIPLMTQPYVMLARNLLYTGVTGGKRLVVLVGQRKALAMADRNAGSRRRWSKLGE
jgi:exodeoxyribonuclease V alpha subunit